MNRQGRWCSPTSSLGNLPASQSCLVGAVWRIMEVWQASCRDGPCASSLPDSSIWELRNASSPYNDFSFWCSYKYKLTLANPSNSTSPIPLNHCVLLVPERAPAWPLTFFSQVSKTFNAPKPGFPLFSLCHIVSVQPLF